MKGNFCILRTFAAIFLLGLTASPASGEMLRVVDPVTLQAALDRALPGDIIQLAPGAYRLTEPLRLTRSGLATQPITVLPDVKERTMFTGPSGMIASNVQHIVLEDLIWFNIKEPPAIQILGDSALIIQRGEFHQCGTVISQISALTHATENKLELEQCVLRLCDADSLLTLRHENNQILLTTFDRCSGLIDVQGAHTAFRQNYFLYQGKPDGCRFSIDADRVRLLNNYVAEYKSDAPLVTWYTSSNGIFAQNSFIHCSVPLLLLLEAADADTAFKATVENNLFVFQQPPQLPLIELTIDGSYITWGKGLTFPTGTFTNWVIGADIAADLWITEDPLVTEVAGIYAISEDSPAIDAGSNRSRSTFVDIQDRIRGLRPDIGAHEWDKKQGSGEQPRSVLFPD